MTILDTEKEQGQIQVDKHGLLRMIDHTLLRADATAANIEQLCDEAREWGFGAVCVNSRFVALAARLLAGSNVTVCSVVGFPLGAMGSRAKAAEASLALEDGASELDMVIAIGAAKSGDWQAVEADVATVVQAAGGRAGGGADEGHGGGNVGVLGEIPGGGANWGASGHTSKALVKVIIECCLLTDSEKVAACQAAERAGADFVKTSTGFAGGGATVEDVCLMRKTVGSRIGVKASGGIKTLSDLQRMHQAGANRFGSSSGVAIAQELLR